MQGLKKSKKQSVWSLLILWTTRICIVNSDLLSLRKIISCSMWQSLVRYSSDAHLFVIHLINTCLRSVQRFLVRYLYDWLEFAIKRNSYDFSFTIRKMIFHLLYVPYKDLSVMIRTTWRSLGRNQYDDVSLSRISVHGPYNDLLIATH